MSQKSTAARHVVACARCHQEDDHPMHHMAAQGDQLRSSFHTDCHALLGCPICLEVRKDVGSEKGAELADVLVAQEPLTQEKVQELLGQTGQEN